MFSATVHRRRRIRRGSLVPVIAAAILAAGACLALVLDRLWLDAARSELTTAAEAAALAGAARLAGDERLNPAVDEEVLAIAARDRAIETAALNRIAGRPVQLEAERDLRLGHLSENPLTGEALFMETDYLPTHIAVVAQQSRGVGNPVARLFAEVSGRSLAKAKVLVEAGLDDRVVALRPPTGGAVPAWPLAVLEVDHSGKRSDTWVLQVEQGQGPDEYRFDEISRKVVAEPDGLSELRLIAAEGDGPESKANRCLIDVGTGLAPEELLTQLERGWTEEHLEGLGGQVWIDQPFELNATTEVDPLFEEQLPGLIGQKRIVLLYDSPSPETGGRVRISRVAAARLMAIESDARGRAVYVLQPAVVATRSAVIDPELPVRAGDDGLTYVFRISLTR